MHFTMNLAGQVNQMRPPKSKALWPLFETIVNSIQSLEETENCKKPLITIRANRLDYTQMTTDGTEELSHFNEFIVTDNGEAYSTLKLAKGCKGIGRFLWLKAFDSVVVESIYQDNNKLYKREFSFSVKNAIEPEENCVEIVAPDNQENCTEVFLKGSNMNIEMR